MRIVGRGMGHRCPCEPISKYRIINPISSIDREIDAGRGLHHGAAPAADADSPNQLPACRNAAHDRPLGLRRHFIENR